MGEYAKRIVFRLRWGKGNKLWMLLRGKEIVQESKTKVEALKAGVAMARDLRYSEGTPSQLVVHGKDGKIQFERTYGKDPEKHKG